MGKKANAPANWQNAPWHSSFRDLWRPILHRWQFWHQHPVTTTTVIREDDSHSRSRPLCVCRSAGRLQPESEGDLWQRGLSTLQMMWESHTADMLLSSNSPSVTQSKESDARTRQSSWLYFAHVFFMKLLTHLNQLVPSRGMTFLSPTQNQNIQESPNPVTVIKGYLSLCHTEKL